MHLVKWVKLPSGCVVPGSSVSQKHSLKAVLKILLGGKLGETIWQKVHLGGAPCQVGTGFVKLASLSSKSTCNLVLHLEFRVHVWLLHSCVQFAVSADWEAPGSGTQPSR